MEIRLNNGEIVRPRVTKYADGNLALVLDSAQGPYAKVSVNIPHTTVPEGCIAVKDWSENEGLLEQLIKAGVLSEEDYGVAVCGFELATFHKILIEEEAHAL